MLTRTMGSRHYPGSYRHLKKRISAIAIQMVAAMNSAEISARFRRPNR
jgi:hypothetical protein